MGGAGHFLIRTNPNLAHFNRYNIVKRLIETDGTVSFTV